MSGWLDLTQLGLAPNQKHQAFLAHRRLSTVGRHDFSVVLRIDGRETPPAGKSNRHGNDRVAVSRSVNVFHDGRSTPLWSFIHDDHVVDNEVIDVGAISTISITRFDVQYVVGRLQFVTRCDQKNVSIPCIFTRARW